MKTITLNDSINILRTYISNSLRLYINFVEKSWCIGYVPKEFRSKGNKRNRYETYAMLDVDILLAQTSLNIVSLSETLILIEKITGWKNNGFTLSEKNKNSISITFSNYYYLQETKK